MSLGIAGSNRAAAAVLGTGPYTARFGLSVDPNGVAGEPTPGANGYARPTITFSTVDNVLTITSAINLGAFTANLGPVRAISLHDNAGGCIACGPLADQATFGSGGSVAYAANSITLTLQRAAA
jgi:hypothetical protein